MIWDSCTIYVVEGSGVYHEIRPLVRQHFLDLAQASYVEVVPVQGNQLMTLKGTP